MDIKSIGLVGYGEVGKIFGAGLIGAQGLRSIHAWDLKFADAATAASEKAHAAQAGIVAEASMEDLCAHSDLVISAVTASNTLGVAHEAAMHISPGSIFRMSAVNSDRRAPYPGR